MEAIVDFFLHLFGMLFLTFGMLLTTIRALVFVSLAIVLCLLVGIFVGAIFDR